MRGHTKTAHKLVFVARTGSLLSAHEDRVRLSRINSGATIPFAWHRSISTFQALVEYDRSAGKRQVAEITIEGGAPDIWDHVDRLEVWRGGEHVRVLHKPWDVSLMGRVAR